jgi:hypothetical protein
MEELNMIQCTRCGGGVPLADQIIHELEKKNAQLRNALEKQIKLVESYLFYNIGQQPPITIALDMAEIAKAALEMYKI